MINLAVAVFVVEQSSSDDFRATQSDDTDSNDRKPRFFFFFFFFSQFDVSRDEIIIKSSLDASYMSYKSHD